MQDILNPVLVTHFDNHPLATRLIFMDGNARPHRSHAVTTHFQNEAIMTLPWPSVSPDLKLLEHIWDFLGRRVRLREPPVHNLARLEAALHEEWQQLPLDCIRRFTSSMRRRVQAVIQARGGYTRSISARMRPWGIPANKLGFRHISKHGMPDLALTNHIRRPKIDLPVYDRAKVQK